MGMDELKKGRFKKFYDSPQWFDEKPEIQIEQLEPTRKRWICPNPHCDGEMFYSNEVWPTGTVGYHHICDKCGLMAVLRGARYPQTLEPIDKRQKKDIERMRKLSGNIKDRSRLVCFIYQLCRGYLPVGKIEEIMANIDDDIEYVYTNGWLAKYAQDVEKRLIGKKFNGSQ